MLGLIGNHRSLEWVFQARWPPYSSGGRRRADMVSVVVAQAQCEYEMVLAPFREEWMVHSIVGQSSDFS